MDEVVLDLKFRGQVVQIASDLHDKVRTNIITFLHANRDCFAWKHDNMRDISPYVITHKLRVDPEDPSVRQKQQKFASKSNQAINEDVEKLLETGKIREVHYPKWLANVIIVKNKNSKW